MDKKILVAFIVSFIILFGYPYYLKVISPPLPAVLETPAVNVSDRTQMLNSPAESDEAKIQENVPTQGLEEYILENDVLVVTLTNYGAAIKKIELKDYKTNGDNFILFDSSEVRASIGAIRIADNRGMLNDAFSMMNYQCTEVGSNEIVFTSPLFDNLTVQKKVIIDDYGIYVKCDLINSYEEARDFSIEFSAGLSYGLIDRYEKNFIDCISKSYDKYTVTKYSKIVKEGFSYQDKVDWVCLENKYFTVISQPLFSCNQGRVKDVSDSILTSYIVSDKISLAPKSTAQIATYYYAGPKDYKILKSLDKDFENIIARGFWGSLRLYLLVVLHFFYKIFNNYGIAIIVLTVIIKVLFAPLTHKSFESMRKMQELQPQMKALQDKHKENPQQLNREVMELYKKHKANPFGGCLPLLLQMPIFIALYQTLSRSIELRGAPFMFWIRDLSEPDRMFAFPFNLPIVGDSFNLLPILMIGSMVWQQKLTPSTATSKEQEKIMLFMPIVFGVIFYNLPSGLVLYWFVNNVLTILQQLITRRSSK